MIRQRKMSDHDLSTFKCLPEVTRSARPLTQPYKVLVYDTIKKKVWPWPQHIQVSARGHEVIQISHTTIQGFPG
jgi:hypothetical protein